MRRGKKIERQKSKKFIEKKEQWKNGKEFSRRKDKNDDDDDQE